MAKQWCIYFLKCIKSFDKVTGLGLSVVTINPFNYKLVSPDYAVKLLPSRPVSFRCIHIFMDSILERYDIVRDIPLP